MTQGKVGGDITAGQHAMLMRQRFFVLWGDADAGFACLEPWSGPPNSLNNGTVSCIAEHRGWGGVGRGGGTNHPPPWLRFALGRRGWGGMVSV